MQTVSDLFKSKIKEASREFECKITIGDSIYTNEDLVDMKISNGIPGDGFMIGATPSATLDLTLLNRGDTIYSTNQIKIEIGLNIGSKFEYLLMGKFNIDEVEKTDYTVKFTAYDNMIKFETAYFSALGDNPTLQQVVNELATKTGVQFTGTLPAYNVKKLEGFTCREVLGYVASLCGGNALITRDGKFTIVTHKDVGYTITPDNYIPPFNLEEVKYKVGKVSCQVGEEVLSKGTLGTDSMELQFENPWITATILTDIYNKLNGFNYLGYSLKWQGDISLDLGDIVSVTDIRGVVRKLPILNQELNYIGGLTSTISAKGETKNKNSFNSSGSMSNKVNRLVTEQAVIKEALIEKANIEDLKATNAEIANLKVKDAEIEDALIKKATIEQLNVTNANIQNLIAEDARINNLVASKASITELNAVSAKIGTVEADTAIIKDLLAGNVTAGSGQIIHLTAKNVTIEDAVIKNLIAAKLSVSDLQAGTISTNKFTIASTDGGLNIVGPTMQFKDKNNKVRIQMGQDTQGNFNFILRGTDGTTTLIDHTGVKEKAIADDLIKSNMVAADAIGEKQINYSSLITGLNKDDNTSLIKASKVAIDLTGQSLEVAFNSLKSSVDNMEIGGKNLILNSSECSVSSISQASKNLELKKDIVEYLNNHIGENVIASCNIDVNNIKAPTGNYGLRMGIQLHIRYYDDTTSYIQAWYFGEVGSSKKTRFKGKPFKIAKEIKAISGGMYIQVASDGCTLSYPKFELGDKATDWTPAPEDVEEVTQNLQTQITVAQGKIEGLIRDTTITEGGTSTSLKDAYISLKATVNGLNSTVASHTSSISTVTTELGKVDGKINTAKADAISTAGADATSKANNALNSAKSYTNAQITTVNTRVSNAESSITQLNNSITNKVWQSDIDKTINTITPDINYAKDYAKSMEDNKGYRYKHEIIINGDSDKYYPVIIKAGNQNIRRKIVVSRSFTDQAPDDWNNSTHKGNLNVVIDTNFGGWGGAEYFWNIYSLAETYARTFAGCAHCGANAMFAIFLRGGGTTGAKYYLFSDQSLTANKYNILPDGTQLPAPQIAYNEDLIFYSTKSDGTAYEYYAPPPRTLTKEVLEEIQSRLFIDNANQARKDIATITTEVTTVKEKAATLETNLNGITSKVTNLESTTSTINGKVNAQETRLQSTEQKVTATGVITTITEAINTGTNSLTTMQFILDKNGATIKNGALRILNRTGKTVLSGDSNGNLTMIGNFINTDINGNPTLEIVDSSIYFYDFVNKKELTGLIYSSVNSSGDTGIGYGHEKNKMLAITGKLLADEEFPYKPYVSFDMYNLGGRRAPFSDSKMIIHQELMIDAKSRLYDSMLLDSSWGDIRFTNYSKYGDNPAGVVKSIQWSSNGKTYTDACILGRRGSDPRANAYCVVGQLSETDINTYYRTIVVSSSGVEINGNFKVNGTKNRVVDTDGFGRVCLSAYETAGSYFGDLGNGILDEEGICYIFFDKCFLSTVNTEFDYFVMLQKYGQGDVWVEKREKDYFIVKGTPNLQFGWEVKCKQIGYEVDNLREDFELSVTKVYGFSSIKEDTDNSIMSKKL